MRSVRITSQQPAPAVRARLPVLEPQATAFPHLTARREHPQPRQGSPTPDPRPPTTQRRLRWSADTR